MSRTKTDLRSARTAPRPALKPKAPENLWEQLEVVRAEIGRALAEPDGPGWFKPSQYGVHKGIQTVQAQRLLFRMYRAGKLERFQNPKRIVWYRIKPNGRAGR